MLYNDQLKLFEAGQKVARYFFQVWYRWCGNYRDPNVDPRVIALFAFALADIIRAFTFIF